MEMILTSRLINAQEALSLGLVNEVAAPDEFDESVASLAGRLAKGPTQAYVRARKLLRSAHGNSPMEQMSAEAESILAAGETRDFYEGITAFIEKRKPTFTGT
ncbi:MAG: hypothetical protein DWP92_03340, partial [Armatimonadetes bacterium]